LATASAIPERPLSPGVINTVSHRPEAIVATAWRTWIMNEQPPTAVSSTHLGVTPTVNGK
jgi:hypothetical protein